MNLSHDASLHHVGTALSQSCGILWPGLSVEVLSTIDSTNTELMRRARCGQCAPVLLAAVQQTAGRGRLGRHWASATGASASDSLTFSLGLPLAPAHWSGLSLAVGLSLAESLGSAIGLKWPNDLWWQGRKLGGILVETLALPAAAAPVAWPGAAADAPLPDVTGQPPARYTVIGVGLNLAAPPPQAVASDAYAPVGLRQAWAPPPADIQADPVTPARVLARLAPRLLLSIRAFVQQGFAPLVPHYHARDVLQGHEVSLSDGGQGQALGVDASGAMRVTVAGIERRIHSAEISLRLADASPSGPEPDSQ